ncbi:MAG: hypothetical protein WAN62_05630, partial [Candidatus Acidiferrum sp.]
MAPEVKFCSILQNKGCRVVQPCQMVTGVGGSSLLSGGKISAYPAGKNMSSSIGSADETRSSLDHALRLFQTFVPLIRPNVSADDQQAAATNFGNLGFDYRYYEAFLYHQHALTDGYRKMVNVIRDSGIRVLLETPVLEISRHTVGFRIRTGRSDDSREILAKRVVLATGRFGADLVTSVGLTFNLGQETSHTDFGVRLEFPTSLWPDIDSCHNDLKLHFSGARTFCVCKDGAIAPYRLGDRFLLEGTSDPDSSTGLTNLGITIRHSSKSLKEHEALMDELRANHFQISDGMPIRQRLADFLVGRPTPDSVASEPASIVYWRWGSANQCLPKITVPKVREAVEYFVSRSFPETKYSNVYVFAPVLDYYWPRFPAEPGFASRAKGLYLVGDCLGHFRGILQAFCSGLVCSESIVK